MSLGQRIKAGLANNRGKLGVGAGVAAAVAAQRYYDENNAMLNKVGYNMLAQGNNLVAPVIGNKPIDNNVIELGNNYYDDAIKNPTLFGFKRTPVNAVDAFGYTKQIQDTKDNIQQGYNSVKDGAGNLATKVKEFFTPSQEPLNRMYDRDGAAGGIVAPIAAKATESKMINDYINENSFSIPIKQMLFEGYTYEDILEATTRQKLAAGALAAGLVATGGATAKLTKDTLNKNPSTLTQVGSIGEKQVDSKLKSLGVQQPKPQYGTVKK